MATTSIPNNSIECLTNCYNSSQSNESSDPRKGPLCIDDSEQWKGFHDSLLIVVPFLLLTVGTLGNTVCYLVLSQKAYKNNIMAGALRYLACVDNLILWTNVFVMFVAGAFDYTITATSYEICAIAVYGVGTLIAIDSWTLVLIITTRYIHLRFPFTVRTVCSKFNYYTFCVFTHLLAITTNAAVGAIVYYTVPKDEDKVKYCFFIFSEAEKVKAGVLNEFRVLVIFPIPCIIIIVINILTFVELNKVKLREKSLHESPSAHVSKTLTTGFGDRSQNAVPRVCTLYEVSGTETYSDISTATLEDSREDTLLQRIRVSLGLQRKAINVLRTDEVNNSALNDAGTSVDDGAVEMNSVDGPGKHTHKLAPSNIPGVLREFPSKSDTTAISNKSGLMSIISSALKQPVSFDVQSSDNDLILRRSKASDAPNNCLMESAIDAENYKKDGEVCKKETEPQVKVDIIAKKRDSRIESLTRLIIVTSVFYIFLHTPYLVYKMTNIAINENIKGCMLRRVIVTIAVLLQNVSYGINFYLYCATGSRFREEFITLLRRYKYYYWFKREETTMDEFSHSHKKSEKRSESHAR